jgi:large subunit ribosomal protein L6
MSRVGKKPVTIPEGVKVGMSDRTVTVAAGKGKLDQWIDPAIKVTVDDEKKQVLFERNNDERRTRAMHGLYRILVSNMIEGLTKGFEKKLTIIGVGYNAQLKGKNVVLQIGFCHPVEMAIPQGLDIEIPNPTMISIKGADKQLVGQFAADIRKVRPPEPYKGKGIRYENEVVRRKVGKALGA